MEEGAWERKEEKRRRKRKGKRRGGGRRRGEEEGGRASEVRYTFSTCIRTVGSGGNHKRGVSLCKM